MDKPIRNRLLILGALWGFVLAAVPAAVAFEDPFSVSPFLVSAFAAAALSGAAGTLLAGRWAMRSAPSRKDGWLPAVLSVLLTGVLQGVTVGVLAAFSIWLAMAVNMSGFSAATPGEILNLLGPDVFRQSAIVGIAVLVYALVVGLLLAPVAGVAINRLVGTRKARLR